MKFDYHLLKLTFGVIATFGLYSVLYRENKFYRLWEHIFLGLAAGWMTVTLWTETLKDKWWDNMAGRIAESGSPAVPGYWAWAILLPIGIMGYFVFSRKHAWISRIPIGIILGLWSGQQVQNWWRQYGAQIQASLLPVAPTTWSPLTVPSTKGMSAADAAIVAGNVYPTQALNNIIATITVIAVLSYFLFSFDIRNRFLRGTTVAGRYLLMIGFGAIFGSTVMTRFSLLIDRMYFIWIEWLQHAVLHK